MRYIFTLLIMSLPLFGAEVLYGDIDGDGREESMELRRSGEGELGGFYQLAVIDDDGSLLWQGPKSTDIENRFVFYETHVGISMPELLYDIDGDGHYELIAPEPQSDVSPTYFRVLKWLGKRFRIVPSKALMLTSQNRFEWQLTNAYEGVWVSGFVSAGADGVRAKVTRYIDGEYQGGEALLRFDPKGAAIVKWIKPLGKGEETRGTETPAEPLPPTASHKAAESAGVKLDLEILISYSPAAKAKLENSHESITVDLTIDKYGSQYIEEEAIAQKAIVTRPTGRVSVGEIPFRERGYSLDERKRYKLSVMIISARKRFENNILWCNSTDGAADYDIETIRNATLRYHCNLIGE